MVYAATQRRTGADCCVLGFVFLFMYSFTDVFWGCVLLSCIKLMEGFEYWVVSICVSLTCRLFYRLYSTWYTSKEEFRCFLFLPGFMTSMELLTVPYACLAFSIWFEYLMSMFHTAWWVCDVHPACLICHNGQSMRFIWWMLLLSYLPSCGLVLQMFSIVLFLS
jgi:hypothetical protein